MNEYFDNFTIDLASEEHINLSPKQLLNICKEKDAEISLLMNEKASLEKSIEELDIQHQVTFDILFLRLFSLFYILLIF